MYPLSQKNAIKSDKKFGFPELEHGEIRSESPVGPSCDLIWAWKFEI